MDSVCGKDQEETKVLNSALKDKLISAFYESMKILVRILEENNKVCQNFSINIAIAFIRNFLQEHFNPPVKTAQFYKSNPVTLFMKKIKPFEKEISERKIEFFVAHIDVLFEIPSDAMYQSVKENIINMLVYGKCGNNEILNTENNHRHLWETFDILVKIGKKYESLD
jgi:CHAT domain-containing protein